MEMRVSALRFPRAGAEARPTWTCRPVQEAATQAGPPGDQGGRASPGNLVEECNRVGVLGMLRPRDKVVQHGGAGFVGCLVGVSACVSQLRLLRAGAGMAGLFGELPAVVVFDAGQQSGDERPCCRPRLHSARPARDAGHGLVGHRLHRSTVLRCL